MANKVFKTLNFRISHQKEISIVKGGHYLDSYIPTFRSEAIRIYVNPVANLDFCRVKMNGCRTFAYRNVASRFGDVPTCDECAKVLCKESEINIYRQMIQMAHEKY